MADLISPEYLELNRQLHARGSYGQGGHRWTQRVATILGEGGHVSVLDYGCGQGTLKSAIGIPSMAEYDPAIEGKSNLPEAAELVVCTDVLEHIEPDKLKSVLKHLQKLTRRHLFVVISTRPASKTLADGRNAHLIVEDAAWWHAKLEPLFVVDSWEYGDGDEVVGVLSPRLKVGSVKSASAVPDDYRYKNAEVNIKKVASRVDSRLDKRGAGHVILCAYGPGLTTTWDSIEKERDIYIGSKVVSVSGAHDYLIERGIIPDYHVEVDPRIHKADFTANSHPDVHYLIGSCCHPKLVDNLVDNGRDVTLFHIFNSQRDLEIINKLEPDSCLLAGGGSVGLRAFNLMYGLGYRSFSLRGMDCSYDDAAGGQHAGPHSGKVHNEIDVQCGDRWFKSSFIMIAYARFFFANYKQLCQISQMNGEEPLNEHGDYVAVEIFGDGLLAEMAKNIVDGTNLESAA